MPSVPTYSMIIMALMTSFLVGCQGDSKTTARKQASKVRPPRFVEKEPEQPKLDFGDDWDDVEGLLTGGNPTPPKAQRGQETQKSFSPQPPSYAICLATFIETDHELAAQEYLQRVSILLPGLAEELSIHVDTDHSMVLFGNFEGWKDPAVGDTTRKLRDIRIQGRQIFKSPILTEVIPPRDPRSIHPMELISVRKSYPNVRVLYTIEVAVWGDFDGGLLSDSERRKSAQDYAQALRQKGHQAWFDHNERKKLSTVTVGIFDHRAIDSDSGIHSDAVERVLSQFPARLVNGELLMEPISPGDPGAGTRVQKPRMVEVPRL